MNPLPQISTRIPGSIMQQKIVMTKLNREASAISSTMKGTKNLVKTISYSIQHFYHPDHSEIQRRGVPKLHSSLVHILFQHSAWQRLTVHFSKIPGENNKKVKDQTGIWQHCLNSECVWRFTWLDFAKDESLQKKCMSGWARFTSRSICSIISEYC